jgi:hypothetical protein
MAHELSQHVDRGAGVSVPLGVAVPVGVEKDGGLVELCLVGVLQRRQTIDPVAMSAGHRVIREGLGAVGIAIHPGQQYQIGQRCVREALPHTLFVFNDQRSGSVVDRQAPPGAIVLEVGVDQRVLAVAVLLDTIPGQFADLGWAASGVDQQPDSDADIVAGRGFDAVQCSDKGGQYGIG